MRAHDQEKEKPKNNFLKCKHEKKTPERNKILPLFKKASIYFIVNPKEIFFKASYIRDYFILSFFLAKRFLRRTLVSDI